MTQENTALNKERLLLQVYVTQGITAPLGRIPKSQSIRIRLHKCLANALQGFIVFKELQFLQLVQLAHSCLQYLAQLQLTVCLVQLGIIAQIQDSALFKALVTQDTIA